MCVVELKMFNSFIFVIPNSPTYFFHLKSRYKISVIHLKLKENTYKRTYYSAVSNSWRFRTLPSTKTEWTCIAIEVSTTINYNLPNSKPTKDISAELHHRRSYKFHCIFPGIHYIPFPNNPKLVLESWKPCSVFPHVYANQYYKK